MADNKQFVEIEPAVGAAEENDQERTPTPPADAEEDRTQIPPRPKSSQSADNRLRPAADILNRLVWDERYDSTDFVIGYEDRFEGRMEASLNSWKRESTDEEFIFQHRILYIKRKSDSEIVWDRRRRIDKIFKSGNSAFDYLAFIT
ncbi:hypothetical protein BJY04DRAFT_68241 [Aspergillus karnatakaensis]|uniref:DUF504 domain-containing protein n=1 Tax=Aspergillus karnatakaensis TaxID=1810916 RepID=UPI003CCCD53A